MGEQKQSEGGARLSIARDSVKILAPRVVAGGCALISTAQNASLQRAIPLGQYTFKSTMIQFCLSTAICFSHSSRSPREFPLASIGNRFYPALSTLRLLSALEMGSRDRDSICERWEKPFLLMFGEICSALCIKIINR